MCKIYVTMRPITIIAIGNAGIMRNNKTVIKLFEDQIKGKFDGCKGKW